MESAGRRGRQDGQVNLALDGIGADERKIALVFTVVATHQFPRIPVDLFWNVRLEVEL